MINYEPTNLANLATTMQHKTARYTCVNNTNDKIMSPLIATAEAKCTTKQVCSDF